MRRARSSRSRTGLAVVFVGMGLSPGRAPATVAEQRARLPPAAHCDDPVAGTWKSHAYNEMLGSWNIFVLVIERSTTDPTVLTGKIENQYWRGNAEDSERPPCRGRLQVDVDMEADGSLRDGHIEFGGTSWELRELHCGSMGGYNLDRFSGTIDPDLQEFQSVHDDDGSVQNVPKVFRRIACADGEAIAPKIDVKPPPFYPDPKATSGCGCN